MASRAGNDWFKPGHSDPVQDVGEHSMTREEFAEECDINNIMARYQVTGMLPANVKQPVYYDFTEMPEDLFGVLSMMDKAQEAFMSLPAQIRREFDNDPKRFVDFASQGDNLPKMREWGLAPPVPTPEPSAESVSAPPSGGSTQSST